MTPKSTAIQQTNTDLTFKRIELSDVPIITPYLNAFDHQNCEYNINILYAWDKVCQYYWAVYKERLIIYLAHYHELLMPVGKPFTGKELLDIAKELENEEGLPSYILFDSITVNQIDSVQDHFLIEADASNADYIYLTEKLANLGGRKLSKKRNLISQFKRNHTNYTLEEMNRSNTQDCMDLAERWCRIKSCQKFNFKHEQSALGKLFDHFEELAIEGLLLKIEDQVIAFTVYSRQNSDTYSIHFEKADPDIKGASQIINQETAKQLLDRCTYLNREQDLGIEGLRKAKRSYLPEYQLEIVSLVPKV